MELVSFIFLFTLLTTSIIGYGLLFSLKFSKYNNFTKEKISIGYIGIFGIIFSIFISYLTNLFLPHNNLHNLFFIIIGITIALIFFFKKKTRFNFNFFLIAYFINFIALLYFKNHDDFSYYHLSFISNINQNKIEFGLSHFDVAFNHNSSLFYFHSLFNTYLTNDYFYHLGPYSIVIFTNAILLEKIFNDSKKNNLNTSFYLSLFFLVFINIFFYRLAEHGTDRSAQILFFLAVILVVNMFDLKKFSNNTFELLLIIFTLIITIKSFYILYLLLLFYVYLKYFKIKKLVSFLKSFPIILFCFFTFSLMIVYNISLSGCLIYPLPATCPEVFFWGYGYEKVSDYQTWYELWSKSGASPNYIVEDIPKYLSGFNWIPNWLDNYFFNKFSDYLLGVIFALFVLLVFFWPKKII